MEIANHIVSFLFKFNSLMHIAVMNGHWCGPNRPQCAPAVDSLFCRFTGRPMLRSACKPLILKGFSGQREVITPVETFTIDTEMPLKYRVL